VDRWADSSGDAWDAGDTLADWAEDEAARLVLHLDLGHVRWRYWARRVRPADADAEIHEAATTWSDL